MSHTSRMARSRLVGDSRASVCHYGRGPVANSGGRVCRDSSSPANVGNVALAVAYNGDTTMATADHTTKEKKMSKSVNIIAYLKADADKDIREVMDSMDDSTDYFEKKTREDTRFYVVTRNGVREVDEEQAEVLKSAEGEELMVREKVEETESFANSEWIFAGNFRGDVLDGVDIEPPSLDVEYSFGNKVKADGRYIFKVMASGPDTMGLLKHPSQIDDSSGGDVWEDKDAELLTLTLTVNVNEVSPTVYRFYDEKVVPEIQQRVAQHEWVERTRVMDCSKEMTEEGVCYDVF